MYSIEKMRSCLHCIERLCCLAMKLQKGHEANLTYDIRPILHYFVPRSFLFVWLQSNPQVFSAMVSFHVLRIGTMIYRLKVKLNFRVPFSYVKLYICNQYHITGTVVQVAKTMVTHWIYDYWMLITATEQLYFLMMTSSNGNIFRVIGPLRGGSASEFPS